MHVGWGMKLLCDSDAPEDASKEDFCLSGLFCGEYIWEAEYGKSFISFLITKYPPYFSPSLVLNYSKKFKVHSVRMSS